MITQTVNKKWGREIVFANNNSYCGKLLVHDKAGSKGSMHYHMNKHESWYVQSGSFQVNWINTVDATVHSDTIKTGDVWVNEPGSPHQLVALEDNSVIIEASTYHCDSDSYRVFPGDNQQ